MDLPALPAKRGVFAGLCTIDLIYEVAAAPEPNSKNVAASQMVFAGGPATNAAITFAMLGGSAQLVSALGRHALSRVVRTELDQNGVGFADLAAEFEGVPPVSSILVTESTGERIVVSANAAALTGHPKSLPPLSLSETDFVLFDGHHLETCAPLLTRARAAGAATILDGGSWKPGLGELIGSFDVVIASGNFAPHGCRDHLPVLRFLAESGVRFAAITRGEAPILWTGGGEVKELPVPQVQTVDTLGAGDVFHGAFCAAFDWREPDFQAALVYASRIASLSCSVHGPRAWLDLV
jgi:sugar/nucleoside kinase (ribokinase family)